MYGSQISEAIMQGFVSSMDPMNGVVRDLAQKQLATAEDSLIRTTSETVELIESKLAAARDRDAPQSVIGAYEKLLARAFSNS